MEDQLTESQGGEGTERTFQGLLFGLVVGVLLWGIAILLCMSI